MALNLGILLSGRGSNFLAIAEAIQEKKLDATIQVVFSNKATAPGLERARGMGLRTEYLDPKAFADAGNPREAYDAAVGACLEKCGVDCVVLAGYMRIVTPVLIRMFPGKMVNIHPSLLPAFPGLHAQQQALEWGAKISGCTVHIVTEGVDEGPIIGQASVPVLEGDTVEALSARILEQEHRLYPWALQQLSDNLLSIEGRRVAIRSREKNG